MLGSYTRVNTVVSLLCLCLCQHVLTGHYSDISINISIRRTQDFDIFKLMSWLSSLAHKRLHKLLMLTFMLMFASLVGTGSSSKLSSTVNVL